jgi:hypothetical protein
MFLSLIFLGPSDGHLPDPADQDSAAVEWEANICISEPAKGVPETTARVVREKNHHFESRGPNCTRKEKGRI